MSLLTEERLRELTAQAWGCSGEDITIGPTYDSVTWVGVHCTDRVGTRVLVDLETGRIIALNILNKFSRLLGEEVKQLATTTVFSNEAGSTERGW